MGGNIEITPDGKYAFFTDIGNMWFSPPGTSAIWLVSNKNRMHLKLEQVKQLINNLQNWVKEGKFE